MASAQPSTFPSLPIDDARIQAVTFCGPTHRAACGVAGTIRTRRVELRFDDMTGDYTPWEVQIVHCDRHWQPSDLHPSEYLQGFYSPPPPTTRRASERRWTSPCVAVAQRRQWTRSGSYLLQIVDPYEPEQPLVQQRFDVFEELCDVDAKVGEPSDLALVRNHQEVHFTVKERNYSLSDPYDRLTVTVVPNWTWSRAITGREPRFVKGAEIDFAQSGHVFEGGNTYRFVDLKGLEFSAASSGWKSILTRGTSGWRRTSGAPTTTSAEGKTSTARPSPTTTASTPTPGATTCGCIGLWTPHPLAGRTSMWWER